MNVIRWWFVGLLLVVAACEKKDPGSEIVDPAAWLKKHKVAVDAFQAKLTAAALMAKDLPPTSVRHADPEEFQPFMQVRIEKPENAVMLSGFDLPELPEYGKYKDKAVDSGETGLSLGYTGYFDFDKLRDLLEAKKSDLARVTNGEADYLVRKLGMIRYVVIYREVSYLPGTLNTNASTFTPGSYEGVAHVIALDGPTHLGSVAFRATNTGKFESFKGSEPFMLQMDLAGAAMRAFAAEFRKVFPGVPLPDPPAASDK